MAKQYGMLRFEMCFADAVCLERCPWFDPFSDGTCTVRDDYDELRKNKNGECLRTKHCLAAEASYKAAQAATAKGKRAK